MLRKNDSRGRETRRKTSSPCKFFHGFPFPPNQRLNQHLSHYIFFERIHSFFFIVRLLYYGRCGLSIFSKKFLLKRKKNSLSAVWEKPSFSAVCGDYSAERLFFSHSTPPVMNGERISQSAASAIMV